MKKTLAFVLTAVMSLSLLAGCGSKTTAPDNTNNDQPQQAALWPLWARVRKRSSCWKAATGAP